MSIPTQDGYMFTIDFVPGGLDLNLVSPHEHPEHYGVVVATVRVHCDDVDGKGITEGTFSVANLPKQLEQYAADLYAMHFFTKYPELFDTPGVDE